MKATVTAKSFGRFRGEVEIIELKKINFKGRKGLIEKVEKLRGMKEVTEFREKHRRAAYKFKVKGLANVVEVVLEQGAEKFKQKCKTPLSCLNAL